MVTVDDKGNLHRSDGQFMRQGGGAASFDLTPATVAPGPDRAYAADVTYDELVAMSSPTASVSSRMAAACSHYPGTASRAACDPDPFVRAFARHGWDLPAEDAARLDTDPDVQAVLAVLQGHPSVAR